MTEAERLYRCNRCGFTNVRPICHGPGSGDHGEGNHTIYVLADRVTQLEAALRICRGYIAVMQQAGHAGADEMARQIDAALSREADAKRRTP